ncbi:MAG: VOC family protein [Acetobacteraceae bacterium]|nr:VOC family protein [Acetobacteraceae bacterium]
MGAPFAIDRIDHVVLNVRDVEAAAAWYEGVLGMRREIFGPDRRVALRFGDQKINLRPVSADADQWITGASDAPGAADLCFVTAAPPETVIAHLADRAVPILTGPVPKPGALGPMRSVYCRDPDGNLIEIATYPPA